MTLYITRKDLMFTWKRSRKWGTSGAVRQLPKIVSPQETRRDEKYPASITQLCRNSGRGVKIIQSVARIKFAADKT